MEQSSRRCQRPGCSNPLPTGSRADRKWCSGACQSWASRRSTGHVAVEPRKCSSCLQPLTGRKAGSAQTCQSAKCRVWNQRHPGEPHPSTHPRLCAWCKTPIDHRNGKARFCENGQCRTLYWNANNVEACRATNRRYQRSERGKKQQLQYREANGAKRRQWARNNRALAPERYRNYWNAWAEGNQESLRLRDKTRHSRRRANGGSVSLRDWQRLVRRYRGCCAYCGAVADPVCMDHVIPLAKGGRHTIGNVLPACGYCNSTKHALLLVVWRIRNAGGRGKPLVWSARQVVVRGEQNVNARLTPDKVRRIRQRHAEGVRQVALAAEFGITQAAVSNIVRRKTWKHVT